MTEKKQDWNLVPDSTIIGVEFDLRKGVNETSGVDKKTPSDDKAQEELEVCEPQILFEAFDDPQSAKILYWHSRIGYERMKKIFLEKMFGRSSPALEYCELDPTNALSPLLPGFNQDNRVIVKSAKSMKCSVYSGYGKAQKGNLLELYFEIEKPTKYLLRRDYNFNPDDNRLTPYRIPVILSGEREGVDRYAGLSFEILRHQLEPATTRRMNQRLRQDQSGSLLNDLEKLIAVGLYEEAVVATGIARYWLSSTSKNTGFNASTIGSFNPFGLHSEDSQLSFMQAQRVGVDGVLDFYESREWGVIDYLNGTFRSR